jgi:hypothetical protein
MDAIIAFFFTGWADLLANPPLAILLGAFWCWFFLCPDRLGQLERRLRKVEQQLANE